ncbi:MAG: PEP-CTERM sorting domain-containing protein [Sedimentisphaerales bacterium]
MALKPIENGLSVAHLDKESPPPDNGTIVAGNVPSYYWYYGCSPTSGGMIVGYWDSKPGYQNLFYGDASVQNAATRAMIASPAHITAGAQNGYTYGDWHNSASYPNHESNPDCIADFMHTVDGGSTSANIASGLEAYVEWDNPATPINESYQATALNIDDPYWGGGTFTYSNLKAEINADRPVLLDLLTYHTSQWYGHSIACYGYQDNMFTIYSIATSSNIIVPGIAVDDTWQNGTAMSEWLVDTNNDGIADSYFPSYIDPSGVEWWPYYTLTDSGGSSFVNYWDWIFSDAVTLDIVIPEPATICMFALGVLGLLTKRKA